MNRRDTTLASTHGQNRGMALVIVMIVIAMLALSAYTFTTLMVAENEGVVLSGRQLQARAAVDSGVAHVKYFLELDELTRQDLGGTVYNTTHFQAQLVADDGRPTGRIRFGVLAPEVDDLGYWNGMRFGLEDESARLNLNALDLETEGFLGDETDETSSNDEADQGGGTDDGGDAGNPGAAGIPGTGAAGAGGQGGGGTSSGGSGRGGSDDAESDDSPDDEFDEEDLEPEIDKSGRAVLMGLPGMTLEVADAILDWIDDDDIPREYGAEFDYYGSLDPPYSPKNGPPETIGELLLVRGMTPELLYGRDMNHNGLIDPSEQALPMSEMDDGSGLLDRGWASYLTLYGQEKNVSSDGLPRIDLNQEDMQVLFDEISAIGDVSWATFIVAYKQFGPREEEEEEEEGENPEEAEDANEEEELETEPAGNQTLDFTQPGDTKVEHIFDLIDAKVEIKGEDEEESVIIESPFTEDSVATYLPALVDSCTVNAEPIISGRVNINRAPHAVLMTIPGMTTFVADSIVNARDLGNAESDVEYQTETWPLTRGLVTLDEMREMMPFMTGGGDVFRAQIVGYFDDGHIFARCEVIVDATSPSPRLLSWKDISHLGRGFPAELLGVAGDTQ